MEMFLDCVSCAGFIPSAASACPHCGQAVVSRKQAVTRKKKGARPAGKVGVLGAVATAAAGGLMSLTLMACYGVAYVCEGPDKDGDGYVDTTDPTCSNIDCDDDNPDIHPGASDPGGDGIDQNCDGIDGSGGSGGSGGTGGTGGHGGTGGAGGATGGAGGATGGAGGGGGTGGATGGAGGGGGTGGSTGGAGGGGGTGGG